MQEHGRFIDEQHQRLLEVPSAQPLAITGGGEGYGAGDGDEDTPALGCEHIGGYPAALLRALLWDVYHALLSEQWSL